MDPKIFSANGEEQGLSWLWANYGPVEWDQVQGAGWALVEIREDADLVRAKRAPDAAAVLMVKVLGADGQPVVGEAVARWWPDPNLPLLPEGLASYHDRGVVGHSNEAGDVGFGMGGGDAYFPPEVGASEIWLGDNSARMCGLGWLGGTNHFHLNLVFQWVNEDEPEPPPPPPSDDWREAVRRHAQAILDLVS